LDTYRDFEPYFLQHPYEANFDYDLFYERVGLKDVLDEEQILLEASDFPIEWSYVDAKYQEYKKFYASTPKAFKD
jgi:hypothetical protein